MAQQSKRASKTTKSREPRAEGQIAPPAKPIDLAEVAEMIEDLRFGNFAVQAELSSRIEAFIEKRNELAVEEARLRHELAPVVAFAEGMRAESIAAREATQFYDDALRSLCGKIQLKAKRHWDGNRMASTGARPWAELREKGATDEQVWKNLRSVPGQHWQDKRNHEFELQTGTSGGPKPARCPKCRCLVELPCRACLARAVVEHRRLVRRPQ